MTPLWCATRALRLSAWLHGGCAAAIIACPAAWPWLLGIVAANHLLLGIATMLPRSQLLGANLTRLPAAAIRRNEIALTFDDGPDPEITPQVLDLLDRYGAKASFFCIAERAAVQPELIHEIVRRGHSVENHTLRHPHAFSLFGAAAQQREIAAAQAMLGAICSSPPRFFRAPAGFRNPLLIPLVERASLRYVSWTRRGYDSVARNPDAVARRLLRGLGAGDILLLHDGCALRSNPRQPVVLQVLPRLLEALQAQKLNAVSLQTACDSD